MIYGWSEAIDSRKISYTLLVFFVLVLSLPAVSAEVNVSTETASNITSNSFDATGSLDSLDEETEAYIEYRIFGEDSWKRTSGQILNNSGTFSEKIQGLNENAEYEYRAVANQSSITREGEVQKAQTTMSKTLKGGKQDFQTRNFSLETFEITQDTNVGTYWLNLRGEVSNIYSELDEARNFNFSYRKEGNSEWRNIKAAEKTTNGKFEVRVEGLKPNTSYEYKSKSHAGEGDIKTVRTTMPKTLDDKPVAFNTGNFTVETLNIQNDVNIGTYWLNLRGKVSDISTELDTPRNFNFSYREKGENDWKNIKGAEKTTNGKFEVRVEGLKPNTVYEVRATSHAGIGNIREFRTTVLKTLSGGEVQIGSGTGICDEEGPDKECIITGEKNIGGDFDIENTLIMEKTAAVTSGTTNRQINIFNSSYISGQWIGNFKITSSEGEAIRLQAGAEFKPDKRIKIGGD